MNVSKELGESRYGIFKMLFHNSHREVDENRFLDRDLYVGLHNYEAGMLTTAPERSICLILPNLLQNK
jgi:hypothetical protein